MKGFKSSNTTKELSLSIAEEAEEREEKAPAYAETLIDLATDKHHSSERVHGAFPQQQQLQQLQQLQTRRSSLSADSVETMRRDDSSLGGGDDYSIFDAGSIDPVDEHENDSICHDDDDDDDAVNDQNSIQEEFYSLARTKMVARFKVIVFLVLSCAAIIVTVLIFHFTKTDEIDEYDDQYETFSREIAESTSHNMDMKLWAATTLASVFTSRFSSPFVGGGDARSNRAVGVNDDDDNRGWPYVTMADFEQQARGTILLAHAEAVYFAPLLTNETLVPWLAYANDISTKNNDDNDIYSLNEVGENVSRPRDLDLYFPTWQLIMAAAATTTTTPIASGLLFDSYSEPIRRNAIDRMMTTREPVLSDILYHGDDDDDGTKVGTKEEEEYRDEPTSILYSPIFRDFTNRDIVGFIGILFNWSMIYTDVLPEHVEGLVLCLKSPDGKNFTYQIDGKHAGFVDGGDQHDRDFSDKRRTSSYSLPRTGDQSAAAAAIDDGHRTMRKLQVDSDGNPSDPGDRNGIDAGYLNNHAVYTIAIYPSTAFEGHYLTNRPAIFCAVVALIFFFTSMTFVIYDCLVENRQAAVMKKVVETSQIIHSLFPAIVRDRLLTIENEQSQQGNATLKLAAAQQSNLRETPTVRLKAFLNGKGDKRDDASSGSQGIIADLFPETTILFADIAGFTAWSSEREPSQVFELLEAIYGTFDLEAKRQGVFKIETIGDCYLAATGLPEQRPDHAVVMARFAQRILVKFHGIIRELELSLGPGTASLGLRIGMHSGAVTAGVLRGEKSRFQLFGDTMNTASRMESTSKKNMIQASPEASHLLKEGGKSYWLVAREDIVVAKGKGEIQTYWVRPKLARRRDLKRKSLGDSSTMTSDTSDQAFTEAELMRRLIKWNAAVLENLLVSVMNHRSATVKKETAPVPVNPRQEMARMSRSQSMRASLTSSLSRKNLGKLTSLNEVDESKHLARSMSRASSLTSSSIRNIASSLTLEETLGTRNRVSSLMRKENTNFVGEASEPVSFAPYQPGKTGRLDGGDPIDSIGVVAKSELLAYVSRIACMYRSVHFHNFEHASHVTMSANKLMKKISETNSTAMGSFYMKKSKKTLHETEGTHAHRFFTTFGIASDPLSHLAVVFAALIHDVDHYGVPNNELIKENPDLGSKYKNTSVAEQNSIGKAWELLMGPDFVNLRECIFGKDDSEKHRFKQLLIRIIIATDIADRDRMMKEKKRWNEAFTDIDDWEKQWRGKSPCEQQNIDVSIKATAVLEQLMLASDIAHTMQHWITFAKWNERLFKERMVAFVEGKSEVDPRVGWYESELGFFDYYIIPLATRLKQCGVFGTAGDEYLGYALKNRQEWTEKGQSIVTGYIKWATRLLPEVTASDENEKGDEDSCCPE